MIWGRPFPKTSGLGKLSARDAYKLEQSKKRYLRRSDSIPDSVWDTIALQGVWMGFKWIRENINHAS